MLLNEEIVFDKLMELLGKKEIDEINLEDIKKLTKINNEAINEAIDYIEWATDVLIELDVFNETISEPEYRLEKIRKITENLKEIA